MEERLEQSRVDVRREIGGLGSIGGADATRSMGEGIRWPVFELGLLYFFFFYVPRTIYIYKTRGFAKKGYTSLFLRQKGAHLKNIWAIYNKHSMISHCSPFWWKNTGEYPPVSIQLNKCPFLAVEITPFWRMHEIISERAVPSGSTTALKSQSGCD